MRLIKTIGWIVLVIAFIAGISYLTHLPALSISEIKISGNSAVDTKDLEKIVQKNIAGNYLLLFSRANAMLYPKQTIINDIQASFKRIESLNVGISNPHTLSITVVERKPAYVWCKGIPADKSSKGCYLIDTSGYVFAEAPVFSGNAYFTFYGPLSSRDPIGANYLNPDEFNTVDKFITWLDQMSVKSQALLLHNDYFELSLASAAKIIFKDIKSTDELLTLQSTLQTIMGSTDILSPSSKLEYIDVRFGNKVYYKFTGDNMVQFKQ